MSRLVDQAVRDIYRNAASTEPAPGGGSVTALGGMLGVALVLKALRISLKRREDAAQFGPAEQALEQLAQALAADADADAEVFSFYMAALRMDKSDPSRAGRIDQAAAQATEAGLQALQNALEGIERSRSLGPVISRQMAPDLVAGLGLLDVMRLNAIENAEANLASVKDPSTKSPLAERLAALKAVT